MEDTKSRFNNQPLITRYGKILCQLNEPKHDMPTLQLRQVLLSTTFGIIRLYRRHR